MGIATMAAITQRGAGKVEARDSTGDEWLKYRRPSRIVHSQVRISLLSADLPEQNYNGFLNLLGIIVVSATKDWNLC